jgi:hypothetical protein
LDVATQLLIKLNDLVIADRAVIPLVNRAVETAAYSNDLRTEPLQHGPFNDLVYWNIANWNYKDGRSPLMPPTGRRCHAVGDSSHTAQ